MESSITKSGVSWKSTRGGAGTTVSFVSVEAAKMISFSETKDESTEGSVMEMSTLVEAGAVVDLVAMVEVVVRGSGEAQVEASSSAAATCVFIVEGDRLKK